MLLTEFMTMTDFRMVSQGSFTFSRVLTAPHVDYNEEKVVEKHDGMTSEKLVICPYYTLEKWDVDGEYEFKMDKPFLNVSVIDGKGEADGIKVKKGDHFIVPATMDSCGFSGKMTVMVSYC